MNIGKIFIVFSVAILVSALMSSCSTEGSMNLENIKNLKEGMSKEAVLNTMGQPLVKEVYNTENVWFYYTESKWSDGNRTSDECTPLVFEEGKLIGWGHEFYKKYKQKNW